MAKKQNIFLHDPLYDIINHSIEPKMIKSLGPSTQVVGIISMPSDI